MEQDSVWLRQEQMGKLFGRERSVITKHLRNIFTEGELEEKSNVQNLHITGSDKPVKLYNLDVIISVGYRVKSIEGTRFRQWATQRLREYLVQGYTLNQQRLEAQQEKLDELKQAIALSARLIHNKNLSPAESRGILAILEKYSHALTVLDDYATLPQRFLDVVFVQLLAIGVPPDAARRERDAMQPLTITATTPYPNRLSLQANLKDYAWLAELWLMERDKSLAEINAWLADNIVSISGKLEFPREFVLNRLNQDENNAQDREV